ncbi:MAG: tRNA (guanosine(37)-N1)-methyltransferase TrmD [Actinomycetota bacterium]|nr:tRNA (guanosine(37)-N1)-methyltransferase TrmD [Actinomycetota bacterium]
MRIDVLTIFPDLIEHYAGSAMVGRARAAGVLDLRVHDLRSLAPGPHRSVDDSPFGGGAGMVLSPGPIVATVDAVQPCRPIFLLSPAGRRVGQQVVEELAGLGPQAGEGFSLLCGRYEGVDQRIADHVVDGELSIGDLVLAGGELAALVVVEAVARLLPGALGNEGSAADESFTEGLLEYPQYTRPAVFQGWAVPSVLLSGDHGRVARWRRAMALRRTMERRPDLIAARGGLSAEEQTLVDEILAAEAAEAAEAANREEGLRAAPTGAAEPPAGVPAAGARRGQRPSPG